jgi:hypothetical protein
MGLIRAQTAVNAAGVSPSGKKSAATIGIQLLVVLKVPVIVKATWLTHPMNHARSRHQKTTVTHIQHARSSQRSDS